MLEQAWRRLALVVVLAAVGGTFLITRGIRLGLDLQGGARLVYRVDIEKAKKDGDLPKDAEPREVMTELVTIIGRRIDPQGVKDPSITTAGEDRIVIELPRSSALEAQQTQKRIEDLGALEMRMVAYEDYQLPDGATFDLEEEKKRLDTWLAQEENQALVERDPREAIEKFNALPADEGGPKAKKTWFRWAPMFRRKVGTTPEGEPVWRYERDELAHPDPGDLSKPKFLPLNEHEPRYFTGEDLDAKAIMPTTDPRTAEAAIAYEIKPGKAGLYGDLSEENIGKEKAILLNGYVRLAPVFKSRINGRGMISGGFTQQEVSDLVIVLKTGSLRVVPILESNTTIGPTLGQIAIEKGTLSIVVGALLIVAFMLTYYRVTGVIAIIALLVNVALVFGALAFISSTLTLPGLAGIVLTIGMAVDANILIFERIREERDRGKDLIRGVEAGFDKAMSTILDANITTFLTGLILYNVGIGPIRGFAVTLMLGIVCSVFSAVFVGKMLFHYLLTGARTTDLKMARLFATPKLRLLRLRRIAAVVSLALIVAGLAAFFSTDTNTKYGLDFTGGAAFQVALREPMTQAEILDALTGDDEFMEDFRESSPQVVTLSTTATESGGVRAGASNAFLIKLKLTPEKRREFEQRQQAATQEDQTYTPPYIDMVRRILGAKLAYDPFSDLEAVPFPEENFSIAGARLHTTEELSIDTIREQLGKSFPEVMKVVAWDPAANNEASDRKAANDIHLELKVRKVFDPNDKAARDQFLSDVQGDLVEELAKIKLGTAQEPRSIVLSSPFPESSLIGSRAVGELRDAAIAAILLSLIIIVMYIRVRFHEYKYGFAASAALVHDVIITLGIVTLLNRVGIIHAEIDLSMIAAFLTIIGYSLNDTIVVFDRIRENAELQKKLGGKQDLELLLDSSVNQTLSRTVLTSVTTFLVVATLFVFNYGAGSILEGFAFSMMVGIVIGTYSSIWVANPIVLWLTRREKTLPTKPEKVVKGLAASKLEEQPV